LVFYSLSIVVSDSDTLIADNCGKSGNFPVFILVYFVRA